MIQAGFTYEDPITHSRIIVLPAEAEANGTGWLLEFHISPQTGPIRPLGPEHIHLTWTETFEIISGSAYYKLNGVQCSATAGDTFVVAPGQSHLHPWNAGDTELVVRQLDTFAQPSPRALHDVMGVFATLAGLAREGKVNKQGYPKNPLQLFAMLKTLHRYDGYDTKLPIGVQKLLSTTLGSLAEALGYRATYPRFVGNG